MAAKKINYLVCNVQDAKVTWVNGEWVGKVSFSSASPEEALMSCPDVWDFLNEKGAGGWDLTTVDSSVLRSGDGETRFSTLYLKRLE